MPDLHTESGDGTLCRTSRCWSLVLLVLAIACFACPTAADTFLQPDTVSGIGGFAVPADRSPASNASGGPQIVHIGTYVLDFSNYNPREGSFQTSFYVTLVSDPPVNPTDFEMMNGHADTIGLLEDTPTRKYFRVFATLDANPDFHRFPFDRHTLPIIVEPRVRDTSGLILVIHENSTGLDPNANLPGWEFKERHAYVLNHTYGEGETPYSRAIFAYDVSRDSLSTFLKFFLPVMLIVIVALSSLLMRVTSRLGLNASMFLAAVLIHWRIADAMPMVEYATFLDYFMMVTYATLVMVLISGILINGCNESKDTAKVDLINYWSVRLIPVVSLVLYALLFLTLLS